MLTGKELFSATLVVQTVEVKEGICWLCYGDIPSHGDRGSLHCQV